MSVKSLGQVFTPNWIVELILDEINYVPGSNILNKTILEPSFGEGVFLKEAISRLITSCKQAEMSPSETAEIIERNIWGVEYDELLFDSTIKTLNDFIKSEGIPSITWNLFRQDALTFKKYGFYDYVVGNPPYVRIHNMDEETRNIVKNFSFSFGTTDLYVVFFDAALEWVKDDGEIAFITPNSFMRNTSQSKFREALIRERYLTKMVDFGTRAVFSEAATYTAVTFIKKNILPPETFTYVFEESEDDDYTVEVKYSDLSTDPGAPFVYGNVSDQLFLKEMRTRPYNLGELCNAQYAISTLRDSLYVSSPSDSEAGAVRSAVKASNYKTGLGWKNIIFPYRMVDGKVEVFTEEELASYPVVYSYLLSLKPELLLRDMDKNAEWFQYGRSQGLVNMFKEKLVFSHVVSRSQKRIVADIIPDDTVVYSGLFITAKDDSLSLNEVKRIMESEDFIRYVKIAGKRMSSGFMSFSAKVLKNYRPPVYENLT